MLGVFGIPQDVVVLGRPFFGRTPAVIVGPDDLVEKALPAEDLIQHDLAVMHLAVIDVEVQAAVRLEHPVSLLHARGEEGQEIVKVIGVTLRTELDRLVALALEAHPVAVRAALGADLGARLGLAGVEGRVDVDQVDRLRGQGLQDGQVIAKVNAVGHMGIIIEALKITACEDLQA
jgi:hypothetical protein